MLDKDIPKDMRFLVVDDQFNVRRMVANFLRSFGFKHIEDASDGDLALDKLKTRRVDFVVCDWNMPNMTGYELLAKMREDPLLRKIPFLMVTAEVSEDIVAEAIEGAVDGYILKPFKGQTLYDKIKQILEKAANPDPVDQALMKAQDYFDEGKLTEAKKIYEKVLEKTPKSPRTLMAISQVLDAEGKSEEAVAYLKKAVTLSPKFIKAHDQLAGMLKKSGKPEEAVEHMRIATQISPRNAKRQLVLGKELVSQGRQDEALAALNWAQEFAGDDADTVTEVGEVLLAAGMHDEAAEAFTVAVGIDPSKVHIYNRLGIAYRRKKDFGKAADQYRVALGISPKDENLYFNLAVALAEWGKRPDSREALRKALELKPDFVEAKKLLDRLNK